MIGPRLSPKARKKIQKSHAEPPSASWIEANTPRPGSQEKVVFCSADITAYLGNAGGGKTTAGVLKCLKDGTETIIYRREFTQLRPIDREIRRIAGPYGKPNKAKGYWTVNYPYKLGDKWHSKRVTIQMSGCRNLFEAEKRQGDARDVIVFDEICHFPEDIFRFLVGWNRSGVGDKCKVIVTGNPPTSSVGIWVKDFWADWLRKDAQNPAEYGEIRWFAYIGGDRIPVENKDSFNHEGQIIRPFSTTVYPSILEENTTLWESGYLQKIQMMPEPMRSRMLAPDLRDAFDSEIEDDAWQIISRKWVMEAVDRWRPRNTRRQAAVGADIARGGKDKLAIAWRSDDNWIAPLVKIPGVKVEDGDAAAVAIINTLHNKKTSIFVDVVNVGNSTYDYLKHQGFQVIPINGGQACDRKTRNGLLGYENLATALWWNLRELLEPPSTVALPNDPELIEDLCSTRYVQTTRGAIAKEKKAEVRKRLGRSPDCADALIYCFADGVVNMRKR